MPDRDMTDRAMTFLIHGLSKTGKSTLAATAPAPRLLMDVEAASRFLPIKSVKWDPLAEAPPQYDGSWDTAVVPTNNWLQVQKAYEWLVSGQHPFRSFIIDSISELQYRYIENVSGRAAPKLQEWGDIYRAVGGLIRDIRDLTFVPHAGLECIVMTAMTEVNDKGAWTPLLQGQLRKSVSYFPDVTGFLYLSEDWNELAGEMVERRILQTRRSPTVEAGERVQGRVAPFVENPNLAQLILDVFGPYPEGKEPPA